MGNVFDSRDFFRRKGSDMEKKHQTLKELPVSERPYEKFEKSGAEALSDAELLAMVLRSGTKDLTAVDLSKKILATSFLRRNSWNLSHFQRGITKDTGDREGKGNADSLYCGTIQTVSPVESRR